MALIECSDLEMVYSSPQGEIHALNDINFDIEEGEFVSAVGPSGCGKSTLLKIVAGLLPATAGSVVYDGEPITGPRRDIGFMFQSPVLLPWRNSLENVLLPGELFGR
ncbi:MAG TPA: ATP-binding cassette domain-containing protein, partial [Gammaproteobacteria bacterium]|nr:ATP-binding cassette domain-containing protein [Gammaproteobacteria bacterium]